MDQCTHEIRLQYWKNIISQCQARPAGQSAKQWLKENGICEQTYYLWQRKIRQSAYEKMQEPQFHLPVPTSKEEITFAEIPLQAKDSGSALSPADLPVRPVAVINAFCEVQRTPMRFRADAMQIITDALNRLLLWISFWAGSLRYSASWPVSVLHWLIPHH